MCGVAAAAAAVASAAEACLVEGCEGGRREGEAIDVRGRLVDVVEVSDGVAGDKVLLLAARAERCENAGLLKGGGAELAGRVGLMGADAGRRLGVNRGKAGLEREEVCAEACKGGEPLSGEGFVER